jgi:hypothetical protein
MKIHIRSNESEGVKNYAANMQNQDLIKFQNYISMFKLLFFHSKIFGKLQAQKTANKTNLQFSTYAESC